MKLGGHVSVAGGLLNAVIKTQEIDANCIQIFSSPPRNWYGPNHSENAITEFNEEVDKQSLRPIFIHATYLTNLASINPQTRVNSIKMLKAELEFGDKIRAAGIIFHIGSHKDQTHEVGIKLVIAGVKEILRNNYQTPLLLENAAGENNKIGSDLKDLETISRTVNNPHLGYCLDTAHLYSAGYDLSSPSTINSILQIIDINKLKVMHLNDTNTVLGGGRDKHENIGKGNISLSGFSNIINHPQLCSTPFIIETPGANHSGPDKQNISTLKNLMKKQVFN